MTPTLRDHAGSFGVAVKTECLLDKLLAGGVLDEPGNSEEAQRRYDAGMAFRQGKIIRNPGG